MKFRMIDLGHCVTHDLLYDYRIQLTEYSMEERYRLSQWLIANAVPHTTTGSVIYVRSQDAVLFSLRWAS